MPDGSLTHFSFAHRVFSVPGAHFRPDTDEAPVFCMDLGDVIGSIALPSLRKTFSIDADGPDGHLLLIVPKALRAIRVIRPGDAIPTEVIDGRASWKPDAVQRAAAEMRLARALIAAVLGDAQGVDPVAELESGRVTQTLLALCGMSLEQKGELMARVERLVDGLALVEVLRARCAAIVLIRERLNAAIQVRARDRAGVQDMRRVIDLMAEPIDRFRAAIEAIDATLADAPGALRNPVAALRHIAERRNKLHFALVPWQEIADAWRDTDDEPRKFDAAFRRLYAFIARRHIEKSAW
ncbi:MAG: hypothetical protein IBJ15_19500 [Alphaproteobacteria bacterium]|nr:hypothetical protein [Alphaproteobacteria bacterium]